MKNDEIKSGLRVILKNSSRFKRQSSEAGILTGYKEEKEGAVWHGVRFPNLDTERIYPAADLICIDEAKEKCFIDLGELLEGIDLLSLKNCAASQSEIQNALENEMRKTGYFGFMLPGDC